MQSQGRRRHDGDWRRGVASPCQDVENDVARVKFGAERLCTGCLNRTEPIGQARACAFHPHARAKKPPRAAECLVYSLTPSGVLAENHPKNRGFVGILRGQKCLKRRFSRRSPLESGLAARARCPGFLAGVAAVSRPRSSATATMQLYFRRSGSSRDAVLQNQVERAA